MADWAAYWRRSLMVAWLFRSVTDGLGDEMDDWVVKILGDCLVGLLRDWFRKWQEN